VARHIYSRLAVDIATSILLRVQINTVVTNLTQFLLDDDLLFLLAEALLELAIILCSRVMLIEVGIDDR